MKGQWLLSIFMLLLFLLSGCSNGPEDRAPSTEARDPNRPGVSAPANNEEPSANDEDDETQALEDEDGVQIFEDADGLVSVRIEDGRAELTYNLAQWDALHGLSALYSEEPFEEGPFAIVTEGERVAEACVGRVETLDEWGWDYDEFVTPAVVLLMDDGTVECAVAAPLESRMDGIVYSFGRLPWLEDIVSLSFEETYEGVGGHTVYAIDGGGVRRDVSVAASFRALLWYDEWECRLDTLTELSAGYDGTLRFLDEQQITYSIGGGFEVVESYVGSYRVVLSDDDPSGYAKGLMIFDLSLDYTTAEGASGEAPDSAYPRRSINGGYFAQMTTDLRLSLWLSGGDCLYNNQFNDLTEPKTEYVFMPGVWAGNTAEQDSHEMAVQFVCDHPQVQEYLALGMVAISTGETSVIDGLVCCDVALGTDNGDRFVREILYSFCYETWQVYEFDVLTNSWIALEMG